MLLNMLLQHPKAFAFSVIVHVLLLSFVLIEVMNEPKPIAPAAQKNITTIKTTTVDAKALEKQKQAKEKIALQKQQKEKKHQQDLAKKAAAKKKAEQDKKKKADKIKADKKRAAKKLAEQKKAAKKKAQAKAKKEEAERLKKEQEEKKKRDDAEKKRLEIERIKKEEEQQKALALKKLADERRAAEEEQKRFESELQAQIAAEEKQRDLNDFKVQYLSAIQQKIQRNWRQPINAGKMPDCEVNVLQGPGGLILDVTFGHCPGTRNYRSSVENAVYKSEPLPEPKDASLFDRDVKILFKPRN